MDRELIIRLAQEAGWDMDGSVDGFSVRLERFATLVAAAEREECAKVCEAFGKTLEVDVGDCFAEEIRSKE